jgi:HAMP domain-containing protein
MNLSKLDIATIAVVVSGAVWLGTLQGTVNTLLLDREQIKEERETTLNEINAEKEKMLAEIAKAQQEFKRLRDKPPATEEIAKAQQEFNALAQALQVTKEEIAKAQQEVSGINRQRDKALADIQSAKQGAISDFQNSLSSAEEKLNALQQIISSAEERINALLAQDQPEIKPVESQEEKAVKVESSTTLLRFIDNGDGTVTDKLTGLIWLKNANCFGTKRWELADFFVANLASGGCGLSDGSKAGDWRLPTKDELVGLLDKSYSDPMLSNAAGTDKWSEGDAFSGVQSSWYWTSTTDDTSRAGNVGLRDGDVDYNGKTDTYSVWAVRGGQ